MLTSRNHRTPARWVIRLPQPSTASMVQRYLPSGPVAPLIAPSHDSAVDEPVPESLSTSDPSGAQKRVRYEVDSEKVAARFQVEPKYMPVDAADSPKKPDDSLSRGM